MSLRQMSPNEMIWHSCEIKYNTPISNDKPEGSNLSEEEKRILTVMSHALWSHCQKGDYVTFWIAPRDRLDEAVQLTRRLDNDLNLYSGQNVRLEPFYVHPEVFVHPHDWPRPPTGGGKNYRDYVIAITTMIRTVDGGSRTPCDSLSTIVIRSESAVAPVEPIAPAEPIPFTDQREDPPVMVKINDLPKINELVDERAKIVAILNRSERMINAISIRTHDDVADECELIAITTIQRDQILHQLITSIDNNLRSLGVAIDDDFIEQAAAE